jgi:hypothetical protein
MPNFVKILDKYWKGNIQTNKQTTMLSVHLCIYRKGMAIKKKLNAIQEFVRHSKINGHTATPMLARRTQHRVGTWCGSCIN